MNAMQQMASSLATRPVQLAQPMRKRGDYNPFRNRQGGYAIPIAAAAEYLKRLQWQFGGGE